MSRSKLMNSALCAAFMAAICASTPAMALEAKQCLPIAEMNAALRAEGQRTLILGNRMAIADAPEEKLGGKVMEFANAVTSNADGSIGYQLEGNRPRAEASTEMCVAAQLTNIKLLDARGSQPARAAFLGGPFDQSISTYASRGAMPMLVADSFRKNGDGTKRMGLPVVLLGNMADTGGAMLTRKPDGHSLQLALLADLGYTPTALQRLDQGKQLAALDPK